LICFTLTEHQKTLKKDQQGTQIKRI